VARKNQQTFAKRQREQKKAKKAADKRARREVRPDHAPQTADATEAERPDDDGDAETTVAVDPS
jgi:hypothetical protein